MKALPSQFDRGPLTTAVATPTCSSCCCCCCCLATTISTSSLLAQRINREGKKKRIPRATLYTTLAALYLPIVAAVMYFGSWAVAPLKNCQPFTGTLGDLSYEYQDCSAVGSLLSAIVLFGAPFFVLWFLYRRVQVAEPLRRAVLVTLLIALAFGLEFVIGAALILATAGIAYAILVPAMIAWVVTWYARHIGKEFSNDGAEPGAEPDGPALPPDGAPPPQETFLPVTPAVPALSRTLLPGASNNRHGIALRPQRAPLSMSDVRSIVHVGVPNSVISPWESASGGVGRVEEDARLAAIGESVERYCAAIIPLPLRFRDDVPSGECVDAAEWHLFTDAQRADPAFPFAGIYSDECPFTNAFSLQDNSEVWIPHPFVALRDDFQTGVPTSSGLAAGPTALQALLRAIQELIERDALMVTWLHSLPGRAIALPPELTAEVAPLHGDVRAFDLTPAYSPFPVIAVAGGIPQRGKWRYSLGVACRETWEAALEKAYLEWNQGVLFAGIYGKHADTSGIDNPRTVRTFDEHAMFYTLHPDRWPGLPFLARRDETHEVSVPGRPMSTASALRAVRNALRAHRIRVYYRDLTTIDADQLGVGVVRATSPDLAAIFAHQEWPLLGGLEGALASRYPWAPAGLPFPNPMPHPLG